MQENIMQESLLIGATRHVDVLHKRLNEELKSLEVNGLQVRLEKNSDGKISFVACNFIASHQIKESMRPILLGNVANAICEIILNHWERYILKNIIRESYFYFNADERETILSNALEYISGNYDVDGGDFYRGKRKRRILKELSDFLRNSNHIVIDGFIRFRLKDYVNELYEIVEQAVDNFLMEKEYREFVQLLKYFVDVQESRVSSVNVILNSDGAYQLVDGEGNLIENNNMEEFIIEFISSEINYEDLLISSLVTIAPKEIVFHFQPDKKQKVAFDTINEVFAGKVKYCTGCPLCRKERN